MAYDPTTTEPTISREANEPHRHDFPQTKRQNLSHWMWVILVFALVIRVSAAFYWQAEADADNSFFRFGDSDSYWYLGERIADGEAYEYTAGGSKIFRAPVYPMLLSTVAWIEPQRTAVLAARVLGCLLGTLSVAICYWITRRIAGELAGLSAAVLAATYPGAIGMSIFILSESIFCPLMLGSLALSWLAFQQSTISDLQKRNRDESEQVAAVRSRVWSSWAGLIFFSGLLSGIATLARPSWILWMGMLTVYLACALVAKHERQTRRLRFRRSLGLLTLFACGMVTAMTPWWVRNYQAVGIFVPTTLQVGASLYDSLHAGASGGSDEGMTFSGDFAQELAYERQKRQAAQDTSVAEDLLPFEYAVDQRMKQAAIRWSLANPSDVVRLSLIKFGRTWVPLPSANQLNNRWIRSAEAASYLAIVVLALAAMVWMRGKADGLILFALPCIYFAAIHAVFVGSVRYRQPAILALCIVAGVGTAGIVVVCQRWIKRRTKMN